MCLEQDEPAQLPLSPADTPLRVRIVYVEQANSVMTESDGDLWPSAWADDGYLYSACGDGTGFAKNLWSDILMNRIDGHPDTGLHGERLSDGDAIGPIWDVATCNRKPTGMIAIDGNCDGKDELYLAVQDLRRPDAGHGFDEAPTATIVRSDDYGKTWVWPDKPMFSGHTFTTIMFLDLGQSGGGLEWVYSYGLDGNWRTSHSGLQPDPTHLYLARVSASAIQDRSAWEFFTGMIEGHPIWSSDITQKQPVLTDRRRMYADPDRVHKPEGFTTIAQGGVTWNPGLQRYIYVSWSEFTHEFFEAPAPWGPWNLLGSIDYGSMPWSGPRSPLAKHGGYAPTIPSKFISADGKEMWLQSNWFLPSSTRSGRAYSFGLRKVRIDPGTAEVRQKLPTPHNVALDPDTYPLVARVREGQTVVLNDGRRDIFEDSGSSSLDGLHYWGYQWPSQRWFNRIVYVPGPQDSQGGWFETGPHVEARIGGVWTPIGSVVEPNYPQDYTALEQDAYSFTFAPVCADGIRIIGEPGGHARFTSIGELEVWCDP